MKRYPLLLFLLPSILTFGAISHTYVPPSPPPPEPSPLFNPDITSPVSPIPANENDVFVSVDFLWWQATVTNLYYAVLYESTSEGNVTDPTHNLAVPQKFHEFDWQWDPGFRISLGFNTSFDGWDFTGDWTHFFTCFDASKDLAEPVVDPIFVNQNPPGTETFSLPWVQDSSYQSATHVRSKGSLQLNQVDLELGRHFWISHKLSLRPYGGFRGHFSHLDFRSKGRISSGPAGIIDFGTLETNSHFRQELWGAGLLAGVSSNWHIIEHVSIFGSGAMSLLYGAYKDHVRYKAFALNRTQTAQAMDLDFPFHHEQVFTLYSIFDLALGVRFENTWSNARFNEALRLILDIGWEMHYYPAYNRLDRVTSSSSVIGGFGNTSGTETYLPADGDLTLMGLVVRGRFEF